LVNFLYFASLGAGLIVWAPIVVASRGRWMGPVESLTRAGGVLAIPTMLALAALWIGAPQWAPWANQPDLPNRAWMNSPFLFGRDLAALGVFWLLAWRYVAVRRRGGGGKYLGPWLILTYALVFSLIGFDLVMGLDPQWFSSLMGAYFFISGLYIALAAWALAAARQVRHAPPEPSETPRDRLHDLGKLIVAFALLTTYLMFSQLLPIWYENMPRETAYVIPRLNFAGWQAVGVGLLATVYLGPLVLLLAVRAKRSPRFLGAVALVVLAGMWAERWWLVAPTFSTTVQFGLPELSMAAAFVGVAGLGLRRSAKCGVRSEEVIGHRS
jgi:hypothetical protein